jgi:formylglycine-generating enzyme required for sulfatase activity/tRNA A-37 threonylcarbamoyl transferase component Bud32
MEPDTTKRLSLDDAMRSALKSADTLRVPPPLSTKRFEIGDELGRGGSAVVYRAFDRKLGREVAVKVLRDEDQNDPELAIRFRREAETAARLSHPNLVTVFDVGWESGRMFLVMELVKGRSLSAALQRGELETRRAVEILEKISRAAHFAHQSGVIHRDLKPGNVLLGPGDEPKIADFGLARRIDSQTYLTASGTTVGTPGYMAPEQALGKSDLLTPKTDVYALGAILYYVITGKAPHDGDAAADVLRRIVTDEPVTPRRLNASAPADLEVVCMKALEKIPARRYPDAAAFADELRRHLGGERIVARPPGMGRRAERWARRHVALTAAGAVFLLALAGLALGLSVRSAREAADIRNLAAEAEHEPDPDRAADLYVELRRLDPAWPGVNDRIAALRSLSIRQKAESLASEGAAAQQKRNLILSELEMLQADAARLVEETWKHSEKREQLWKVEAQIQQKEQALLEQESLTVARYSRAAEIDATYDVPRRFLADYHWKAFLAAETAGDAARMAEARGHLQVYDPALYQKSVDLRGSVTVVSDPHGANVEILRFSEGDDRRLAAVPCAERASNLPGGSYVAILKLKGFRDARLPFSITRGVPDVRLRVRMRTEAEIGEGFVYVPAGRYLVGEGRERRWVDQAAFVIGKYELTCGEYVEYLEALLAGGTATAEELKKRVAKSEWELAEGRFVLKADKKRPWRQDEGWRRLPVTGVSWNDGEAYCRWRADRDGLPWRLQTVQEREVAARGADARRYPWGNSFDWLWTNGGHSRKDEELLPVGSVPEDESPFGVMDLAGNVKEWCADVQDQRAKLKAVRGAAFKDVDRNEFETTFPDGDAAGENDIDLGIRLVRSLGGS